MHGSQIHPSRFFEKSSVSHLGFKYSDGVSPTAEKTKAILKWPSPKCTKNVRSFLGLANFYHCFVPKFADIAAPLTSPTGNQAVFKWEDEHEKTFNALKQSLSSPPVIIIGYPKQGDTFTLTTDASDVGLGTVLSITNGAVVEYASRALTQEERKYATIEKECLAIVWATRKFRHYPSEHHLSFKQITNPWNGLSHQSLARLNHNALNDGP